MKKLVLGVLAAALMSVSLSTAPAQAGPYTGTVGTSVAVVAISKNLPRTAHAVARVRVLPKSGNAKVRAGVAKMICMRTTPNGNVVRRDGRLTRYNGDRQGVIGPRLYARANWRCIVKYYGKSSVYKTSQSAAFRVRVR
ncbi:MULTISPECIES: hypothetical protein [Nocardioides]|uniref:Uncharacterized protein n=1 Tax=Nocardioides vastitatis TaxID=2568655 RepID=A0ABW0Z8X4_9ACTN|nr:hypothetical protein [Nocardioides sp.]THJ02318.1 hypothetical protein E7Z54_10275 [Nocardioides sp.]